MSLNNKTKIEKLYEKVKKKNICNEEKIKELQTSGLIHNNKKRNYIKEAKESEKKFREYAKKWDSLKGKWTEKPPPPPKLPNDCIIM